LMVAQWPISVLTLIAKTYIKSLLMMKALIMVAQ